MGTGPPALIYGLERSELGDRVLFVDENTLPGGSWRTVPAFGYERVEPGVHYFECRPCTRPMLANILGPDGLRLSDGDFALFGRRRVPMRYARPVLYGLVAGKAMIRGKAERTLHSLRHMLERLRPSRNRTGISIWVRL